MKVRLISQCIIPSKYPMYFCLDDDAHEELLNLSPSELKNLLYHILSGKEFRIDQDGECT